MRYSYSYTQGTTTRMPPSHQASLRYSYRYRLLPYRTVCWVPETLWCVTETYEYVGNKPSTRAARRGHERGDRLQSPALRYLALQQSRHFSRKIPADLRHLKPSGEMTGALTSEGSKAAAAGARARSDATGAPLPALLHGQIWNQGFLKAAIRHP